ncbi:unnamed protein product [Peronospora farinosa]|uniref:Cytochrome P450 n=1 Tax=Peronospora farinosa TaxID=134698 RepID=A0AAV0UR81_9STRA|nr:unnamed protein product [Peronospora farinosa]
MEARKLPPMPRTTLPFLKNILDAGGNAERFHDWLNEQSIEFDNRPWMFAIPGRPATIVISSPEMFKDVLVTQDDIFLRGPPPLLYADDEGRHGSDSVREVKRVFGCLGHLREA